MAPSTATAVLGNDDLLHQIFQHCQKQDIQSLRQCSRQFDTVASEYLFTKLTVGHRKRYIRRLKRVAACKKFCKGVRELVWETASYECEGLTQDLANATASLFVLARLQRVAPRNSDSIARITSARMAALSRDEHDGDVYGEAFFRDLRKALKSLSGVRHVTFTTWPRDAADVSVEDLDNMPPPFSTLLNHELTQTMQMAAFRFLMLALGCAKHKLTSLRVFPTTNSCLHVPGTTICPFRFPGFSLPFDAYLATPQDRELLLPPLQGLRELHLELGDGLVVGPEVEKVPTLLVSIKNGGLGRFLSSLPTLESLRVQLKPAARSQGSEMVVVVPVHYIFRDVFFSNLQHLHLEGFWEEQTSDDLCALLSAHSETLETVELSNINIGGVEQRNPHQVGVAHLIPDAERDHVQTEAGTLDPNWRRVAETCSTLPKLNGLYIGSPSVSMNRTYLSVFDTEELMDIGLNGNDNKIYDGPETWAWMRR